MPDKNGTRDALVNDDLRRPQHPLVIPFRKDDPLLLLDRSGDNRLHHRSGPVYEARELIAIGLQIPMGRAATPVRIAASATAGAMVMINRGSKGLGIRNSGPNLSCTPYAMATTSDGSAIASSAIARVAASFISSLIVVAPTSSAPRNMNGKQRT